MTAPAKKWQFPPVEPISSSVKIQEHTTVKPAFLPEKAGSLRAKYEKYLDELYLKKQETAINMARENIFLNPKNAAVTNAHQQRQDDDDDDGEPPPQIRKPKIPKIDDPSGIPGMEYARTLGTRPLINGLAGFPSQLQATGLMSANVTQMRIPAPAPTPGFAVFSLETAAEVVTCEISDPERTFEVKLERRSKVYSKVYPNIPSISVIPTISGSTRRMARFQHVSLHHLKSIDASSTLMMLDDQFEKILSPMRGVKSIEKNFPYARVILKNHTCISRDMVDTLISILNVEMATLDPDGTGEFTSQAVQKLKLLAVKQIMLENLNPKTTKIPEKNYASRRTDELKSYISNCTSVRNSIMRDYREDDFSRGDEKTINRQLEALNDEIKAEINILRPKMTGKKKIELGKCPAEYITLGLDDIIPDNSVGMVYTCKSVRVIPSSVHHDLLQSITENFMLWEKEFDEYEETDQYRWQQEIITKAKKELAEKSMFGINKFYWELSNTPLQETFVSLVHKALYGTLLDYTQNMRHKYEFEDEDGGEWF